MFVLYFTVTELSIYIELWQFWAYLSYSKALFQTIWSRSRLFTKARWPTNDKTIQCIHSKWTNRVHSYLCLSIGGVQTVDGDIWKVQKQCHDQKLWKSVKSSYLVVSKQLKDFLKILSVIKLSLPSSSMQCVTSFRKYICRIV